MLVIDSHDFLSSNVRTRNNSVVILANRCVINEKLSSEDYKNFFEVIGIDGAEPTVEFKKAVEGFDVTSENRTGEGKLSYLLTKVTGLQKVTV